MKYTTKTEYGLICLSYMATKGSGATVTVREIAGAESYSQSYLEKIMQQLRLAGVVSSAHGQQGGYILTQDPTRITLLCVIEALEGSTFEVYCEPKVREQIVCTHHAMGCQMKAVWQNARRMLNEYFGSLTVASLVPCKVPVPEASAPGEAR